MKNILLIFLFVSFVIGKSQSIIKEAETGVLTGTFVNNFVAGFSGSGYVDGFDNDGDNVLITIAVPTAGLYKLEMTYASTSHKENHLYINGVYSGELIMNQTSGFEKGFFGNFDFISGQNTIVVDKSWGWILLDNIILTPTSFHDYDKIVDLIDLSASQKTQDVWTYLKANYGDKVISGQNAYYTQLEAVAGKSPKVRSFDFQSYTQGYPYKWSNQISGHIFGWHDDGTTDEIINWYNSSGCGIVAIQWHWHSPTGGSVSTNTFRTHLTTFDITKAVNPQELEYAMIIEDIDSIATQLKRLQALNIPVLWRPLHEAGGGWFWWGAGGAQAALEMWDIIQDRLMNYHQLDNLIWVWSTPEPSWFPGNDKIDIIGYDSYPGSFNYIPQKSVFDQLYEMVAGEKIVAMTENGPIPNIDELFTEDAVWSYFSSWDDLVVSQNTTAHILDVYNNSNVLTLSDPCITTGIEATEQERSLAYPNPFVDVIYLKEKSNWKIYNSLGLVVKRGISSEIQTGNLASGLYILEMDSGDRLRMNKF